VVETSCRNKYERQFCCVDGFYSFVFNVKHVVTFFFHNKLNTGYWLVGMFSYVLVGMFSYVLVGMFSYVLGGIFSYVLVGMFSYVLVGMFS
jgi:hypothetical protein